MPIAARLLAGAALVLAAAGCASSPEAADPNRLYLPGNDGANGDVQGMHVRNAFVLGDTSAAGSSAGQPLYAVLISDRRQPDRLERVTVEGGGTVRLMGPVELRPGEAGSTAGRPIGTATGIRGTTVPMTFTFRDAGEVKLMVPVLPKTREYANLPDDIPSPASTPSPGRSGASPKPTGPIEHATKSPG